jgi:hypothetical protein
MSKKTVLRSQTINGTTGEVTEIVSVTKEVKRTGDFILTYYKDIGKLIGCSRGEIAIVLACLKYVEYTSNELVLTPDRKSEICDITKITKDSFYNITSRLFKKNIFIRDKEKTFLNPKLFFRGKDIDQEKWFSLHIDYKILDDSDLDKTGETGMYDFSKIPLPKYQPFKVA